MVRVLFVCLGNICRSPVAEGVFRDLVKRAGLAERVAVDSAGTGSWHLGAPPDPRALASAARRGLDISLLRARQVAAADFAAFDYILAMDRQNLEALRRLAPRAAHDRIRLFLDFASAPGEGDVPDPYYGEAGGFETVLDLVSDAAAGLLAHIERDLARIDPA